MNFLKPLVATALFMGLLTGAPVARAETGKSVALIIDASGSMRARLKTGQRRIEAAKAAVEKLVGNLPGDIRLSLRAYGHQFPTRAKNCKDTQLLSPFASVTQNKTAVIGQTKSLKARGYTPISLVLELAAGDLKTEPASQNKTIILVSDGKETCQGDPCAVAKALADANAGLVVHTIGFAVDVAARYQLQCIAKVARGKYFEAGNTNDLLETMSMAVQTQAIKLPKPIKAESKVPGILQLNRVSGSNHAVISVKTGKRVALMGTTHKSISLPPGFYNVKFGSMLWRSIEVKNGETKTLDTAKLSLPAASYKGHEIRDWETGEVVEKLSSLRKSLNMVPSTYLVMFGTKSLKITLKAGEERVIDAGSICVKGLPINSRSILDEAGKEVTSISSTGSCATLLPARYTLQLGEQKIPFEVKPGTIVNMKLK